MVTFVTSPDAQKRANPDPGDLSLEAGMNTLTPPESGPATAQVPAANPSPGQPGAGSPASPYAGLMAALFGRNSQRVLALLAGIADLSAEQADQVTTAWKQEPFLDRAAALARLIRTTTQQERHGILAAASVARREALATAHRLHRTDWAFWAAASDAAAAVAAGDRLGHHYDTLTAPLAQVMPSLAPSPGRTR